MQTGQIRLRYDPAFDRYANGPNWAIDTSLNLGITNQSSLLVPLRRCKIPSSAIKAPLMQRIQSMRCSRTGKFGDEIGGSEWRSPRNESNPPIEFLSSNRPLAFVLDGSEQTASLACFSNSQSRAAQKNKARPRYCQNALQVLALS